MVVARRPGTIPPDTGMPLRIDFTDRHEQHPPEIRAYAVDKAEKLERFFDGLNHVAIVLDRQRGKHSVEMIVTASPNVRLVGHSAEDTITAAIDAVIDKIERQVVKAKERLKDHHPRDHKRPGS
jgi:putative sigma-54 modulation protein